MLGPLRFVERAVPMLALHHVLAWALGCVILFGLGFSLVVWAWPAKPIPEIVTAAPQVKQDDGSVIAERALQASLKGKPAPHKIPKGAIEERRDTITVAPSPEAAASACPPVTVNLSLIRQGNERRVIASSPDGQVVSAVDVPIDPPPIPPEPRKWAAGLTYSTDRAPGAFLERDFGRIRLGVAIEKAPGQQRPTERLQLGVTW